MELVLGMDEDLWKALNAVGGKIAYQFGHMKLNLGKKRNAVALGQADSAPTVEEPDLRKGPLSA